MLEARFGTETRRLTSGIFMITRLLADSVRLFATAIPLTLVTGWPLIASVLVIGAVTFIYTFIGGIRAVVWVDASQMALYLAGGLIALVVLAGAVPGGWPEILARAGEAGKLTVIDPSLDFGRPYTLWAGLLGGAFLSMGSHGADQLIVQRLLACRDLAASRRALVGSGFAVLFQFTLFLFVGLGLWAWYDGAAFVRADEIFAGFIVEALPAGVRGLLIAGVFAAAMSTLSSSINALSSTAGVRLLGGVPPGGGRAPDPARGEDRGRGVDGPARGGGDRVHPAERGEHRRGGVARDRVARLRRAAGGVRARPLLAPGHEPLGPDRNRVRDRLRHRDMDRGAGRGRLALVRPHRHGHHRGGRPPRRRPPRFARVEVNSRR